MSPRLPLLLLWACQGPPAKDSAASPCPPEGRLLLADENNYAFELSLTVSTAPLTRGEDASLDWSELKADLKGRVVAPGAVTEVALVQLPFSSEELQGQWSRGDLSALAVDPTTAATFVPTAGEMEARFSTFTRGGVALDPSRAFPEDDGATLVAIARVPSPYYPQLLTAGLLILEPTDAPDVGQARLTSASSSADFRGDLLGLLPVTSCVDLDDSANWAALTRDAFGPITGRPFFDRLVLARFMDPDLARVSAQLASLPEAANAWYALNVPGVIETRLDDPSAPLGAATALDGSPFQGFDDQGSWLLSLECTTCPSTVPRYLTVVQVE